MSTLFHRALGKGTPVVLLHGFCESHEIWGTLADELSNDFQLLIPDLPGFGKSPLLPAPFTIDDVAKTVWKWIDNLRLKQPFIVGHSLGGYVALAMTEQRPNDVGGLCLFHSTARPDSDEKKQNRNKVIDFVNRNGVAPYIETFVPGLFFRKDHPAIPGVYTIAYTTAAATLTAYAAAMRERPDRTSVLGSFLGPILIIAGERDEIVPLDTLMAQSVLPSNGRLAVLSDTGHMGMFESPARSLRVLRQWVNG